MKNLFTAFFLCLLMVSGLIGQSGNPDYKWLHPSPIGTSMGGVKVWDVNNIYSFGQAGTFVKTTDGGQTFSLNPFAGVPNGAPYTTTNDLYGAHFVDMNNFYLCGVWGITKTTDGGQTFNQVGAGYFSTSTLRNMQFIDANYGFVVGTSSTKMAKTTDGGTTWTVDALLPAVTYYDVEAFNTSKIIVAGSTSASANIRWTTDGGTSWNAVAAGTSTIYSLAFFDSLIGFASSGSGAGFKTTDGGLTWNALTLGAPTSETFYKVFTNDSKLYFVGDDSLLFVSPDSGSTFSRINYLPAGMTNKIMRSGDVSGSNIYIVGDNGYYIKSTDNGNSWNSNSKVIASGFVQGIYGDQTGKIIAVGTNSPTQVLVSNDFGASFTAVPLSVTAADLRGIQMFDNTTGFAVGSGGRVWKTTDGGFNWELYSGTTTIQAFNDVHFINPQYGMVAGNGGQIWKTTNGGLTWITVSNLGNTLGQVSIAMIDTLTALSTGSTVVNKTTDGGLTWTPITPGVPIGPTSRIKMRNSLVGYLIGGSGTSQTGYVFKTTNAGNTWTNMNFPYSTNMIYDIEFRSDSDYVIVGYSGGVFHTTNDGQSWNQINLGLLNVVQSQVIGLTFVSADTVVVGGAGASLVKFALEPIVPVELSSFTANINSSSVNLLWTVATELNNRGFQVERKTVGSNEWLNLAFIDGRGTTTEIKTYSYSDNDVTSGMSYNYRLRQIDYDGTASVYNLAETIVFGAPNKFALEQNYPNPFNPSTTITFSIPQKSEVSVKIFDILGKEITTLVNETKDAGKYDVNFNASNLASGVYFYSIKAGNFNETKKMTLIK